MTVDTASDARTAAFDRFDREDRHLRELPATRPLTLERFHDVSQLVQFGWHPADIGDLIHHVPEEWRLELARYIVFRVQPGRVLTAILRNNLLDVMLFVGGDAASISLEKVRQTVLYISRTCPAGSFGSDEAVKEWCA